MAKRSRNLYYNIGARDQTRAGLASVHRGFSGLLGSVSREAGIASQAMSGAITGNATFAVTAMGAAFVGFAANAAGAFAEVEQKWAEVTTLMPQSTKAATDQMLVEVRRFSRETGFAIQDSIGASYQALSAGIEQEELTTFLRTAGQAARAGVTDITTGVDAISSALNAYNLEANRSTDVSDAMFTAIRLGKTTFEELAPVMGPVLPIAASLNTEFEEITASVAALTAQGNPTSIALTQIRSALVALSKDTEARSLFEAVVGTSYAEFQAGGGTLVDALKIVVDEAERTGKSVIDVFGRVEAANAALALTSEKGAETFTSAMTDMEGATADAASKIEDTMSTTWDKVGAIWDDFRLGIGQFVTDVADQSLRLIGVVKSTAIGSADGVRTAVGLALEELAKLPDPPPTGEAARGNRFYAPGPDTSGFRTDVRNRPIVRGSEDWALGFDLMVAGYLRSGDPRLISRVGELTGPDDPSITRAEIDPFVWELRNLQELAGYTRGEWRSQTVGLNTAKAIDAFRQTYTGSPFDQSLQAQGFGGGGGLPSGVVGGAGGG